MLITLLVVLVLTIPITFFHLLLNEKYSHKLFLKVSSIVFIVVSVIVVVCYFLSKATGEI